MSPCHLPCGDQAGLFLLSAHNQPLSLPMLLATAPLQQIKRWTLAVWCPIVGGHRSLGAEADSVRTESISLLPGFTTSNISLTGHLSFPKHSFPYSSKLPLSDLAIHSTPTSKTLSFCLRNSDFLTHELFSVLWDCSLFLLTLIHAHT